MPNKLIREGRFGPGKTFKTGSIVGTYPRPLLVLEVDAEGLDIIPEQQTTRADYIKLEVTAKDVVTIKADDFDAWCKKPISEQPKILCVDLANRTRQAISGDVKPQPNPNSFPAIFRTINTLLAANPCPWKTVVLDNTSSLSESVFGYFAATNATNFTDARKWAPDIGNKVKAIIAELCKLPCHFVVIMHEDTEKDETTGVIKTEPMIFSKYRQLVGSVVSQFFHQCVKNKKPVIETMDNGYIKGLGSRWPELPPDCGPTFNDIYGEAVKRGEVEKPL